MRRRALLYVDGLFQASETFVTALIDYVRELDIDLSLLTHGVFGPAPDGLPVTVLPRHRRRGSPAWFYDRTLRVLAGREAFESGLCRFLAAHRFDVLHAQFGQPGWYLWRAMTRAGIEDASLIVNFYGYDATGLVRDAPQWRQRYRAMFDDPRSRVIVEGPNMKQTLVEIGCPEEKVEVIPLCLRIQSLPAGLETPRSSGGKTVLGFVGRFVEKKGLLFALDHLAPVLAADPRLELRLVGDGPDRPQVEERIRRHGLDGRVSITGMVDYERMLRELKTMSVLLVPSHTASNGDSEGGAPTILAEAQILGVPVIASDHADIPYVLADHSYLFREGDGPGLVSAVRRWLAEGSYDVGAARERTRQRYDRGAIQRRYADLYSIPVLEEARL